MALTAGTATLGTVRTHTVAVSATDATSGTAPYTYQWQISDDNSNWRDATGANVTTRTATLKNFWRHRRVFIRLKYTDSAGSPATVNSNTLTATIHWSPRWFPGL